MVQAALSWDGKTGRPSGDLNQVAKTAFGSNNESVDTQTVGARPKGSLGTVSSRNGGIGHRTSLGERVRLEPCQTFGLLVRRPVSGLFHPVHESFESRSLRDWISLRERKQSLENGACARPPIPLLLSVPLLCQIFQRKGREHNVLPGIQCFCPEDHPV